MPLTVQEAAARLGVGRTAIQNAIARGRLKPLFRKMGGYWLDPRDVDRYGQQAERYRRKRTPTKDETA